MSWSYFIFLHIIKLYFILFIFIISEFGVLDIVLEAFDQALPWWCLYRIENLQYIEVIIFLYNIITFYSSMYLHTIKFISSKCMVNIKWNRLCYEEDIDRFL